MKRRSLGEFEELMLLLVAYLGDEAYGVTVYKELLKETGRVLNISAVHVALNRLDEKGLVSSKYGGISAERGGRRKKYYSLTTLGETVLSETFELRKRLFQRIQFS